MSLIFGRLTVTAPSKTVQELKWPLLKVDDEAGLGITQDRLVPGEDFYLIVPSGRYLVRRTDYYVEPVVDASFDVPTSPGAYYLGTLAVTVEGPYLGKIAGAEVIDEFDRAVGELRERNPGFAGLAKKQLMKTLGPQKDLSFSEEHCEWEVCLIGASVSYCPVD